MSFSSLDLDIAAKIGEIVDRFYVVTTFRFYVLVVSNEFCFTSINVESDFAGSSFDMMEKLCCFFVSEIGIFQKFSLLHQQKKMITSSKKWRRFDFFFMKKR